MEFAVDAFDEGNGGISLDAYKYAYIQRYSKLSVNASPEPVTKGAAITVTGKLNRANWETHDYRKTTVTASSDGYRRYFFSGTSTTATVKAAGDYVDVR